MSIYIKTLCKLCLDPTLEEEEQDFWIAKQLCDKHLLTEYQKSLKFTSSQEYKILQVKCKLDGFEANADYLRCVTIDFVLKMFARELDKRKLL